MTTTLPSSFQPLQGYPNIAASHDQPSSNSSSSSDGSFSHVFIVLAIILVISVIGCVLGRIFCKGESSKTKQMDHVRSKENGQPSSSSASKHVRDFPGNHHQEEDIENQLKPIPSSKVAASHDGRGSGSGGGGGGLAGFKPVTRNWEARGIKGHVRFPGDIEFKPRSPGHFR